MKKYLEDLKGKTILEITPLYASEPYMIKIVFTDGTILEIDIAHDVERYLEWSIK